LREKKGKEEKGRKCKGREKRGIYRTRREGIALTHFSFHFSAVGKNILKPSGKPRRGRGRVPTPTSIGKCKFVQ